MSTTAAPSPDTPAGAILHYWLGDGIAKGWPSQDMGKLWFGGGPELDDSMRQRFGELVRQAQTGDLVDWEGDPWTRLALVLLLDQFSRNVFRKQPEAFAGDARAQHLVSDALARHWDAHLPWVARLFYYMPLMHAENLALQDQCVQSFVNLVAQAPDALKPTFEGHLKYAHQHRTLVAQFGRFPYRNAVLQRECTPQELDFLKDGPRFGQ